MLVWNRTATDTVPSADTLAKFIALASPATPLYIEWQRETTTSGRPVVAGRRKCRPSSILRMEIITDRAAHVAYRMARVEEMGRQAHRDRREDRQDYRYWVTASLVQYLTLQSDGCTHYINGHAVPRLADAK